MAQQKYTDQQMLAALRSAAEGLDVPLSAKAYDAKRPAGAPSGLTINKRFGGWNASLQAAGLPTNQASGHKAHRTDADLAGWVARYLADPETTGSYGGYATWSKAHEDAPSAHTIRNRFRTWSAAVKAAAGG